MHPRGPQTATTNWHERGDPETWKLLLDTFFPSYLPTEKSYQQRIYPGYREERDINGLVIHQTGDKIPQIELRNTSKFLSNSGNLNNGTLFFQKRKIRFARQKFQKMICRGRPAFFPLSAPWLSLLSISLPRLLRSNWAVLPQGAGGLHCVALLPRLVVLPLLLSGSTKFLTLTVTLLCIIPPNLIIFNVASSFCHFICQVKVCLFIS